MNRQKLILTVTFCIFAAACSRTNHDLGEDSAKTEIEAKAAVTPPAQALDPNGAYRPWPTWHYDSHQDDMTGKSVYWTAVSSKEVFSLAFPYEGQQSATFSIRVHPDGTTDLMLTILKGQFICMPYSDDGCPINVRLGDGTMRTVNGSRSSDQSTTVVFLPSDEISVRDIAKVNVLRIGIPLYQAGDHVFTFNVSLLDVSRLGMLLPPSQPSS